MWVTDSENIQPSGEPCLSPTRYCHPAGTVTESSKDHSSILSSQLVLDGGEHGKISEFHEHGLMTALLGL